jgi:3-deoxy-D-manno-octulosonic acid kinase
MSKPTDNAVEIARAEREHGAILFDRTRLAQSDANLFDPEHWDHRRQESERGGRGSVWFVDGQAGPAVLRHYRRGGLPGRFNRDRYLWRGEACTRAFREFELLARMRGRGLPVPAPLAATYQRHGIFYRADILIGLIPAADTLARALREPLVDRGLWSRLGAILARFHAEGIDHADLNAHNVMIDARGEIWLIDFDRGQVRPTDGTWKQSNLARLRRSLQKVGASRDARWEADWQSLLAAYRNGATSLTGAGVV